MKTPMQDLIEKLKSQRERQISLMTNQLMIDTVDAVFTYAIENAELMLEKEKQVIIDTHLDAYIDMNMAFRGADRADEYYAKTFNTKDKHTYGGNK